MTDSEARIIAELNQRVKSVKSSVIPIPQTEWPIPSLNPASDIDGATGSVLPETTNDKEADITDNEQTSNSMFPAIIISISVIMAALIYRSKN